MTCSLEQCRSLLTVALATQCLQWRGPAPAAVQEFGRYLDSWKGLGAIVDGMTAQGYDLELMQQPHGWWARF